MNVLPSRGRSLLAAIALALSIAACGPSTARTHVERGETVSTGVGLYDNFFREVTEVKAEADKVASDLGDASKPLDEAVGAQAKATPVPDFVRAEAKKLQMGGTLLHMDLLPETKLVTTNKPDASSEKLLAATEQTAKSSVSVARRAADLLLRVSDLERRRADLVVTAKATFPDQDKRAEITRELAGAESVLAAARVAGEKHGGAASKLALDLAMAVETGARSSAVAATTKPSKPGGGKPGGPGTSAPAKPKGDDFEK